MLTENFDKEIGRIFLKRQCDSLRRLLFQTVTLGEIINKYRDKGVVLLPKNYEEKLLKKDKEEIIKAMKETIDRINHIRLLYCNEVKLTLYEERVLLGQFLKKEDSNIKKVMSLLWISKMLIEYKEISELEKKNRDIFLGYFDFKEKNTRELNQIFRCYYSFFLKVEGIEIKKKCSIAILIIELLINFEMNDKTRLLKKIKKKYRYDTIIKMLENIKELNDIEYQKRGDRILNDLLQLMYRSVPITKEILAPIYEEVESLYLLENGVFWPKEISIFKKIRKSKYLKKNAEERMNFLTYKKWNGEIL